MKPAFALICGLSLISLACATRTTVRQHPEFNSRRERVKNILLVHPLVEINRRVAGGNVEKLEEEAERVAKDLTSLFAKEFSKRGYNMTTGSGTQTGNSRLTSVSQSALQELHRAVWNRFPDLEADANNFKYTLSDDVSALVENTSTDTLVFVKFNGVTRSGGDIAGEVAAKTLVAVLTAGLVVQFKDPSGAAAVALALVDGRSGEVLWGNRVGQFFNALTAPDFSTEDLSLLVSNVIAQFPQRGQWERNEKNAST